LARRRPGGLTGPTRNDYATQQLDRPLLVCPGCRAASTLWLGAATTTYDAYRERYFPGKRLAELLIVELDGRVIGDLMLKVQAGEQQVAEAIAAEHESLSPACRASASCLERLLAPDFHEFGASGGELSYQGAAELVAESAVPGGEPIKVENMRGQLLADGLVMLKYTSESPGRRSRRYLLRARMHDPRIPNRGEGRGCCTVRNMSIPTMETPVALAPKAVNRIRMASFGALTMLVIQFVLGTAYSLYGTAPTSSKSVGLFSSPLLAIHVIMGILLIIAAIMLVVRAIQARYTPSIAATVVGLLVILGAFGAGSSFTRDGSDGASLGMALLTAVAMLCYAANLVILGKPAAGS